MATICDLISANLTNNCDNKPVAGVTQKLTLINKVDILSVTYDASNAQVVTGITLKTGKKAFSWVVYKNTHKPRVTSVQGTYATYWNHEIPTAIMTWDIATKIQAEGLSEAKVIVIAENLQTSGDARFEIYGWDQGLSTAEGAVRDTAANDGVFALTLANEEGYLEPHLPKTFAVFVSTVYNYASTAAAILALETPAS